MGDMDGGGGEMDMDMDMGGGGPGDMGLGGMGSGGGAGFPGGGADDSEFPLDMSVEIYGIIYIYNPPDAGKLGDEQVTEDTVIDVVDGTMGDQPNENATPVTTPAPADSTTPAPADNTTPPVAGGDSGTATTTPAAS